MRNCFSLVLVLALIFASACIQAQTLTAEQESRINELEQLCKNQDQKIQDLQSKIEQKSQDVVVQKYLHKEQTEEGVGIVAGYNDGFFVRGADGNLELKMTGLFQSGIAIFENDSFDNNSFYLAGVYLVFDVHFLKEWHGRVEIDFANVGFEDQFQGRGNYNVALRDAYLTYMPMDEFNISVGQFNVPFTIEGQYAPNQGISIWSSPFINSWSHGRDPGIMIHGLLSDMFEYKISLHNGEGANRLNQSDDFLMAIQTRIYFMGYKENRNSFFHIGAIRSRHNENALYRGASLFNEWGRRLFDGRTGGINDSDFVNGWRTGVDAGLRYDADMENGSNLRVEGEFMYITWERKTAAIRRPFLQGWGSWFGISYRHCMDEENKDSGIISMFKFTYSNIDNEDSKNQGMIATSNIRGQRALTYTFGLGYAFNKHIGVNFNWVIVDAAERDLYGGPKDRTDESDDLENAWFLQITAAW